MKKLTLTIVTENGTSQTFTTTSEENMDKIIDIFNLVPSTKLIPGNVKTIVASFDEESK